MTVLASRDGMWFLAGSTGNPRWSGSFGLTVGLHMPVPQVFTWKQEPSYRHASVPDSLRSTFRFYPQVLYRGFRVHPQGWHRELAGPFLKCYLDQSAVSFGGWEETQKTIASLVEDGWQWSAHQGGIKYIHVDDLEKIEGPPPEGAF